MAYHLPHHQFHVIIFSLIVNLTLFVIILMLFIIVLALFINSMLFLNTFIL